MAKILVISPTPSHPQDAGNRARIFSLLAGLKAVGHQVYFVFIRMEPGSEAEMAEVWDGFFAIPYLRPGNRWIKRLHDTWAKWLGTGRVLPYHVDAWYSSDLSFQVAEIGRRVKPDVVIVEYIFLSKVFECFDPGILKILDTHDVFGDRHQLYKKNKIKPQWFYTTVGEEKLALNRADIILAIQGEETSYFSRLTKKQVLTVGHLVSVPPFKEEEFIADRILFVGSANPINIEALRWFLDEIFPAVRRDYPSIELEIVGACAEQIPVSKGVILTGRVSNLGPHYRRARVVINPVLFGTGLKIKAIEALAYGRPLITTSVGVAGLGQVRGEAWLTADTAEEFVSGIITLWNSEELRTQFKSKARNFIQNYNNDIISQLEPFLEKKVDDHLSS